MLISYTCLLNGEYVFLFRVPSPLKVGETINKNTTTFFVYDDKKSL